MKIAELKALVKRGESETLEFKNSTASLDTGMKTVCAFLNSDHGGVVVFGVTDKRPRCWTGGYRQNAQGHSGRIKQDRPA